jgi:hypothetical protein
MRLAGALSRGVRLRGAYGGQGSPLPQKRQCSEIVLLIVIVLVIGLGCSARGNWIMIKSTITSTRRKGADGFRPSYMATPGPKGFTSGGEC